MRRTITTKRTSILLVAVAAFCVGNIELAAQDKSTITKGGAIHQSPVRVGFDMGRKTGTGVIISQMGIVLTCNSVVRDYKDGRIELLDSKEQVTFKVEYQDKDADVAFLVTDKTLSDIEVPLIETNSSLIQGELLTARPEFNLGPISTCQGILTLEPLAELNNELFLQFPATPGATGAPIYDEQQNLVGIIVGPLNPNMLFMTRGLACDTIRRAIETAFTKNLNGYLKGVEIADDCAIKTSSQAEVKAGNVVVDVEGVKVRNKTELLLALGAAAARGVKEVDIGFKRDNEIAHVKLTQ